jgi:hypothetical protein
MLSDMKMTHFLASTFSYKDNAEVQMHRQFGREYDAYSTQLSGFQAQS